MRTPLTLAAFGGALALAFSGAFGIGSAVGDPRGEATPAHDMQDAAASTGGGPDSPPGAGHDDGHDVGHDDEESADVSAATDLPGGLMVSDRGYTLRLAQTALPAGPETPLTFQVLGEDGEPVTSYERSHDQDLHLIAVRRDTTGFQHVHPQREPDGTWSVPLDLTGGTWRVFADFVPAQGDATGDTLVLGADLAVAGDHQPVALPAPSATAEVDGYTVALDGDLVPGQESELTLSVARDGQPVTDLQPYLAAYGHLVALRVGDLAYLHVHPAGAPGDGSTAPGPDITFFATAPTAGDYRLFLDFRHDDVVRTAELTVRADDAGTAPQETP